MTMANKFDDLLEQFGSNAETLKLNETVLVDKRYFEEQKRKAKVFDEILNVDYIGTPDDYAYEITKIIDKYMEDK